MVTISAVITTFRRPETLSRAIESVFSQVSLPSELLVIDNAGDNETERIVSKFRELARIPVHYFYENKRGVSAARNRGLKEAVCSYVAFLDDDDVWLPHHLSDFLTISQHLSDLALFAGFRGRLGEPESFILPDSDSLFKDFVRRDDLGVSIRVKGEIDCPFYTPSMSESIVEIGRARDTLFDEELLGREDIHFVWRIGKTGSVALHHKIHGLADQLEISLFSVMNNAKAIDMLNMNLRKVHCGIIMLDKMVLDNPCSKGLKDAQLSAYFDSAYINTLAGNTMLAFRHWFRSIESGVQKRHFKLLLRIAAFWFLKK